MADARVVQPDTTDNIATRPDAVSNLSLTPTPSEALGALQQQYDTRQADIKSLIDHNLLQPINIDGLAADPAIRDYKQHFALEAASTALRGVDTKSGATVTAFWDQNHRHLQELNIDGKDGSHQRYLFDGKMNVNEGRSFDPQGHGVAVEHLKWTVDSVTRVGQSGLAVVRTYDGNDLLEPIK